MALFKQKKTEIDKALLPVHLGIIMDGNGRWAKKRALPRSAGHRAGAGTFRTITRYCSNIGIRYLTVYAFSTENWKRPQEEVGALMKLFEEYLREAISDFKNDDIVVRFIGDKSAFSPTLQELIAETEASSKDRTGMILNIAMNYGSRDEIIMATKKIAEKISDKTLNIDDIDAKLFESCLYTAGQPDPDLIIRPSGEHRISNFLLWQSAYAEYIVMDDILWPDFKTSDIDRALNEYSKRNRRFGGV